MCTERAAGMCVWPLSVPIPIPWSFLSLLPGNCSHPSSTRWAASQRDTRLGLVRRSPRGAWGKQKGLHQFSEKVKSKCYILSFSAFLLNCIVCSAFHPIISHSWKTPGKTGETKTALVITGRKRRNKQRNVGLGKQISNMFFIVS